MKTLRMLLILLLMAVTSTALAIDYWNGPPPDTWTRGQDGATYQHWWLDVWAEFPEHQDNPYGYVGLDYMCDGDYEEVVCPEELGNGGTLLGFHMTDPCVDGLDFHIANSPMPNPEKYVFIQITSSKAPTDVQILVGLETVESWNTGLPHIQWPGPAPYGGQWYTYNYGFVIRPNPTNEVVRLTFPADTVLDQVVVDTICAEAGVPSLKLNWGDLKALHR